MRTLLLVLLALVAVGCGRQPDVTADPQPKDPDERLRGQISQGAFDLTAASDGLAQAKNDAADIEGKLPKGDLKETFADLLAYLDSCGATVAEQLEEPPDLAEFKKQLPEQRKRLKEMVAAAVDCIQELDETRGMVDGMLDDPPKNVEADLGELADSLDAIREDLETAIESMGAKPPSDPIGEDEEPES